MLLFQGEPSLVVWKRFPESFKERSNETKKFFEKKVNDELLDLPLGDDDIFCVGSCLFGKTVYVLDHFFYCAKTLN